MNILDMHNWRRIIEYDRGIPNRVITLRYWECIKCKKLLKNRSKGKCKELRK